MIAPTIAPDGTVTYPRTVVRTCGNRKVGAHTVTTSRDRSSCPTDCGMWAECYGTNPTQSGGNLFDNVASAPTDGPDLVAAVLRHSTRAVRFNVVGDFLASGRVDREYIARCNDAARASSVPVWSYTHAWPEHPDRESVTPDLFAFTVRASCESPDQVSKAHAAGWAAVIAVDSATDPIINTDIDGRRVVLCPAQRHTRVTCESCGRCATRTGVIAFARHGLASSRRMRVTIDGRPADA
jgi:hypothetical protein